MSCTRVNSIRSRKWTIASGIKRTVCLLCNHEMLYFGGCDVSDAAMIRALTVVSIRHTRYASQYSWLCRNQ
jgi:hypothetical protein